MIKAPFKKGFACWLSAQEGETLVQAAPHEGAKIAIRLGLNGLRVHEVAKIQNEDKVQDVTVGLMGKIIGKGNKYRTFPLDNRLEFANFDLTNVTTRTITEWMTFARENAFKLTGDPDFRDCTMHDLRRSWTVQCLSRGILPETVKYWGGWESSSQVFEQSYIGTGIQSPEFQKAEREKLGF